MMYFLTWEGISIFDGQRFKNISEYNGESLGLVNDIIQWKNDTCYVFTFQKGVYKLINNKLIKDDRFDEISEPNHVVKTDENKYIITSNIGLYQWDGATVPKPVIPGRGTSKDAVDNATIKGNLLVYSKNGGKTICAMNLASHTITDSISATSITSLSHQPYFPVFLFLNSNWMQLNNEALQKGILKPEPLFFLPQLPPGFVVNNIHPAKNKLWLEDYKKGYLLLDAETGKKELYPPMFGLQQRASLLFTDKENNYWFTAFYNPVQKVFYTKMRKAYPGITEPVAGVFTDENQHAFTYNQRKIFLLQQSNNFIKRERPENGLPSFYWQGRFWTFTTTTLIESESGEAINLQKNQGQDIEPYMNDVGRISFDREGRLLITNNNLYVVEKNFTVHAVKLPYFTDNIATDDTNTYWAFTRSESSGSYTLSENGLAVKNIFNKVETGSPRYAIHWNQDTFCIGTRYRGIVWLVMQSDKLKEVASLNTSKGLSNNFVLCLLRKNKHQLFAATASGLDEISIGKEDTTIQNLSAANNLYLTFSYVVKDNKENIIAYSNNGQLWSVNDIPESHSGFVPAAWFDEIAMNGKAISDSTRSFNFNQNNFRFTVSAPCFINSSNIRFHFLLESGNREWEQQSEENFYSINNLAPGKYSLTATVMYPGKIYPDKKIIYSFTINSPLWKKKWFIALLILFTGLLLWAIIRNYYRRKLAAQKAEAEKQQAIEKERNRISRDMHDDLGSGLTKIAILSEVVKKQLPEPDKAKEQVEKIAESSRELVDNLQDIIWVLNPKNDTLESLAAYVREYALKYFEPLSVKIDFDYPEEFSPARLSEEKRRNVYMTVKESLNNIAKHAWCNTVVISLKESARQFKISIRDDGKGFETEKVRLFANGLKNMQTRIEQSGGTYSITSKPGKGSETIITMPV